MNTYNSTQRRLWASLLVLIYLLAALLPASVVSAADLANSCGGQGLQAAELTANIVAPASAYEEVKIDKQTVDMALFDVNWRSTFKDAKMLEGLIVSHILYSSTITPSYATMEKFRVKYEGKLSELYGVAEFDLLSAAGEVLTIMIEAALEIPELQPAITDVWIALNGKTGDFVPNQLEGLIRQRMNSMEIRVMTQLSQNLKQVRACAQQNPQVAATFDKLYADKLKSSILDGAKTILANNPALPIVKEIRDKLGEDGSISISLNEIKEMSKSEFEKLHVMFDDMQTTLKEIDGKQDVIIDYLQLQKLRAEQQELAKKKAAEYQLKLDAAQSSISILSMLAAQIDPEFGKDISTGLTATLQAFTAINGWLKATAGLGTLDKVTSLSTVVMTGNVLGAVMSCISIFGAGKPTPDQMILEEIGRLRQQINELRVEMHGRFDRIDQSLNTIYSAMMDRFNQIDIQLGKISGNVLEVQQALAALDLKLSRIERNNFELINAVGRRPLLEAINGGLGYRERVGQPMSQAQFDFFENQFHSWATLHAFDPGNVGPTQRDYSDAGLLTELSSYPIDANLNYLNGWMVTHGFPAISNKPLPSPRDWLLASRAYTQLALEEPEMMAVYVKNNPQRQARLQEIGLEMEAAMQKLSTMTTVTNTVGNNLLFTSVISNYQNKIDALNNAIQPLETNFVAEVYTQRLGRTQPFNLHGGIDQTLEFRPPEAEEMRCGNAGATIIFKTPSTLVQEIPNFNSFNLAEYLKLGTFTMCVSDEWVNPIEVCEPVRPGGAIHCSKHYEHNIYLVVNFEEVPIFTKKLHEGHQPIPANADTWTWRNWRGGVEYVSQFETSSTILQPTHDQQVAHALLLSAIKLKLEQTLAGYQQELYGRVLQEMTHGSLKPLSAEVDGAKLLLDTLVSLGLPRAVTNDEFFHAMLYGNQQLVDPNQLLQSYAINASQPITNMNVLANPRQLLTQVAGERSAALSGMVNTYLNAITSKDHAEAPDYLADTRRGLDITLRIVKLEAEHAPTPTPIPSTPTSGANKVYLPLVNRQLE